MPTHTVEKLVYDTFMEHKPELRTSGAWRLDNATAPDLTGPVHPMFAQDRWIRTDAGLSGGAKGRPDYLHYDRMLPALRLASKLITTKCLLPWWCHMYTGNPVINYATGVSYLRENNAEHTRRAFDLAASALLRLSKNITIAFQPPIREADFTYGRTWAERRIFPWYSSTHPTTWPDAEPVHNPRFPDRQFLPVVVLNYEYYLWMKNKFPEANMASKIRFWFILAVTLVHEIAHAAWFVSQPLYYQRRFDEPFHQKGDPSAELGFSWEEWVFGHLIYPITGSAEKIRIDPAGPLVANYVDAFPDGSETKHWQGKVRSIPGVTFEAKKTTTKGQLWKALDLSKPENVRDITWAVPTKWIAQWFQRSTWQKWDRLRVGDWVPPPFGPSFVVNIEIVKNGRLTSYVGVKDGKSDIAKVETNARRHDWEKRGDYSADEGGDKYYDDDYDKL
ncbi:hypothetical protein BU16DRAFT_567140 [Lophium mytilinum]|uniref:Uncharacterized protein n=1 Tax=Lophium mytilinum TaxID=390894 RepID=A0A6A6QDG9_9PEZI|nr:hypothetical protein BU16DRAFT_567140 [Lophium mytilinum]